MDDAMKTVANEQTSKQQQKYFPKSCVRINQFHSYEMKTKKTYKHDWSQKKNVTKREWMIRNHNN